MRTERFLIAFFVCPCILSSVFCLLDPSVATVVLSFCLDHLHLCLICSLLVSITFLCPPLLICTSFLSLVIGFNLCLIIIVYQVFPTDQTGESGYIHYISLQKMAWITGLQVLHALWESNDEDANNSSGTDTEADTDEIQCHFELRKDPAEDELHAYVHFLYVFYNLSKVIWIFSNICWSL